MPFNKETKPKFGAMIVLFTLMFRSSSYKPFKHNWKGFKC